MQILKSLAIAAVMVVSTAFILKSPSPSAGVVKIVLEQTRVRTEPKQDRCRACGATVLHRERPAR